MILPARSTDMSLKQGQNKTSNFCVFQCAFMLHITCLYITDAKLFTLAAMQSCDRHTGKQTEKHILDRTVQRFWVQREMCLSPVNKEQRLVQLVCDTLTYVAFKTIICNYLVGAEFRSHVDDTAAVTVGEATSVLHKHWD